jgi:hypothetical protein
MLIVHLAAHAFARAMPDAPPPHDPQAARLDAPQQRLATSSIFPTSALLADSSVLSGLTRDEVSVVEQIKKVRAAGKGPGGRGCACRAEERRLTKSHSRYPRRDLLVCAW